MKQTKTSQKAIDLIRQFEGEKLSAYKCPAGIWTIGVGHTGPDVHAGLTITKAESEAILRKDLVRFEEGVSKLVTRPITQDMFDALVSFAFNVGLANLKSSTLLRKLNAGDFQGASDQFTRWDKAGGKILKGLTARRAAEQMLFRGAY